MSSSSPRVSVCLPSYNCEDFIDQTIESVLLQTFADFEFVISDDCSTDNTLNIIRKFKDPRIRVLDNKENLGMERNWNKALKKANGEFIKLLCHDDLLYPKCLEKQVAVLSDVSNNNIALVSCKRGIIDSTGRKLLERGQKLSGQVPGNTVIKKSVRAGTNLIGEPTAVMFRADLLQSTGAFNQSSPYLIDMDLWSRLLLKGDAYIIPETLCAFRVSSVSASVSMARSQKSDFNNFVTKLRSFPQYKITWKDQVLGKIMALKNNILRLIFYKFVVKKAS